PRVGEREGVPARRAGRTNGAGGAVSQPFGLKTTARPTHASSLVGWDKALRSPTTSYPRRHGGTSKTRPTLQNEAPARSRQQPAQRLGAVAEPRQRHAHPLQHRNV